MISSSFTFRRERLLLNYLIGLSMYIKIKQVTAIYLLDLESSFKERGLHLNAATVAY